MTGYAPAAGPRGSSAARRASVVGMGDDDFAVPDFSAPFDARAYHDACPPEATIKGMFVNDLLEHVAKGGGRAITDKRYVAFKDYPMREYLELAPRACEVAYPGVPPREALRRIGRSAYPTLASTMIGKVIFGVLGKDLEAVMKVAARGYAVAQSAGRADVIEVRPGRAMVKLTNIFTYVDAFQVGVFEGAILACDREGEVRVKVESIGTATMLATWR